MAFAKLLEEIEKFNQGEDTLTVTDKSNKRARDNIMDWHGIIQGVGAMQSEVAEDCDKESEENEDLEV